MQWTTFAMGAAALLLGTAAATGGSNAARVPDSSAAELIAARQAAFRMSAAVFGGMRSAAERGAEAKSQAFAARGLASWAKALPGMFPPGSGTGAPTEALPTIWSDRAGFEARAADYAAATAKLADLAAAGDDAGFAAQLPAVGKTCSACHDSYRKPSERKPG